jgi:hypothetical protein
MKGNGRADVVDGRSWGPAGHHLRSRTRFGDECEGDASPGRAVLHAGQPIRAGANVVDVEPDPVIGHGEPDCPSFGERELHIDARRIAVTRRVGQGLAGDSGQGRPGRESPGPVRPPARWAAAW